MNSSELQEIQRKLQKLESGVLLSPEEYSAVLQLLARSELAKQSSRMKSNNNKTI